MTMAIMTHHHYLSGQNDARHCRAGKISIVYYADLCFSCSELMVDTVVCKILAQLGQGVKAVENSGQEAVEEIVKHQHEKSYDVT
jgi:hypothetical protein